MAVGTLWYAQQGNVWLTPNTVADATLTSTVLSLKDMMLAAGTAEGNYAGRCKEVTISGGGRDLEAVDTLGINQLEQPKRPEIMTCELTLIYGDGDSAKYIAGTPNSTAITSTSFGGTFVRYQYGEKSTAATDRARGCVLLELSDGGSAATTVTSSKRVYILMNYATCTNREISLSSDGHVEEKMTFKCLAQNYYEEDNFAPEYTTV